MAQEQHVGSIEQDPASGQLREGPGSFLACEGSSAAENRESSMQTSVPREDDSVPENNAAPKSNLESTASIVNAPLVPSEPHPTIVSPLSSSGPSPPPINSAGLPLQHGTPVQQGISGPPPPPPPVTTIGRRTAREILAQSRGSALAPLSRNPEAKDIYFDRLSDYQINENYERVIQRAAGISERLKRGRFRKPARLYSGRIGFVDYTSSGEIRHRTWDGNRDAPPGSSFPFSRFLNSNTHDLIRRLIVVEDLYPSIIVYLIGRFGVSPEFIGKQTFNELLQCLLPVVTMSEPVTWFATMRQVCLLTAMP